MAKKLQAKKLRSKPVIEKINIKINKSKDNTGTHKTKVQLFKFKKWQHNYKFNDYIAQKINTYRKLMAEHKSTGYIQMWVKTNAGYFPSPHIQFGIDPIDLHKLIYEYAEELCERNTSRNPFSDDSINSIRSWGFFLVKMGTEGKGKHEYQSNCGWLVLMKSDITHWKSDAILKERLHLKPEDGIRIEHWDYIEKEANVGMWIEGQAVRVPKHPFTKNIYIKMFDDHYDLAKNKGVKQPKVFVTRHERSIVIYEQRCDDGTIKCFDGLEECECEDYKTVNERFERKDWIIISLKDIQKLFKNTSMTAQEAHSSIKKEFLKVKEVTHGEINMFQTGWTADTAKHYLYYHINKKNIEIDPIEQYEYEWIDKCNKNAYIFKRSGKFTKCVEYDQICSYLSFMQQTGFYVPIKKGDITIMTTEQFDKYTSYPYGIFRATVEPGCINFRYNRHGYYTHIDLNLAKNSLHLKVSLTQDEKHNALLYPSRKLGDKSFIPKSTSGSNLFGDYAKWIYKLKREHPEIKMFKSLSSGLHGMLAETFKYTKYATCENGECDVSQDDDVIPVNFEYLGHGNVRVKQIKPSKIYKTNLARMKPFIYATQKKFMCDMVLIPHGDHIVRMHTDGFVADCELPFLKNGTIGDIIEKNRWDTVEIAGVNDMILKNADGEKRMGKYKNKI